MSGMMLLLRYIMSLMIVVDIDYYLRWRVIDYADMLH